METTIELLERVRAKCTPPTYYRVSKVLGVQRQAVSNWKAGRERFSDEVAERVAGFLGVELGYVLACVAAERASRPAVRRAWEKVAQGLAVVLVGVGLAGAPAPAPAADQGLCIMSNRRRHSLAALQARLLALLSGHTLAL